MVIRDLVFFYFLTRESVFLRYENANKNLHSRSSLIYSILKQCLYNVLFFKKRYFSRNLSDSCSIQVHCFDKLYNIDLEMNGLSYISPMIEKARVVNICSKSSQFLLFFNNKKPSKNTLADILIWRVLVLSICATLNITGKS